MQDINYFPKQFKVVLEEDSMIMLSPDGEYKVLLKGTLLEISQNGWEISITIIKAIEPPESWAPLPVDWSGARFFQ